MLWQEDRKQTLQAMKQGIQGSRKGRQPKKSQTQSLGDALNAEDDERWLRIANDWLHHNAAAVREAIREQLSGKRNSFWATKLWRVDETLLAWDCTHPSGILSIT